MKTISTHDLPQGDVRSFVFSNWLRSLRYQNDFYKLVDPQAYWSAYQRHLNNILAREETRLNVAELTDDPDVLLGFAVYRGPVLDYVFVHKHQRRLGIATALLPKGLTTISHLTKTGLAIWGSKLGHLKFNPFD